MTYNIDILFKGATEEVTYENVLTIEDADANYAFDIFEMASKKNYKVTYKTARSEKEPAFVFFNSEDVVYLSAYPVIAEND